MSLDINWDKLVEDNTLNEHIKSFLDRQFQSLSLPSYIDNLSVTAFNLGNTSPSISIRHIGDPFDEFYEEESQDDEKRPIPTPQPPRSYYSDDSSDEENNAHDLSVLGEDPQLTSLSERFSGLRSPSPPRVASPPHPLNRARTSLDSISLFIGNNVNYLHNYNMNNVGLGNLNSSAAHTGTDTPTNIFSHNPYSTYRNNSSSLLKAKDRPANAIPTKEKQSSKKDKDIQFIVEIDYHGDMHLEVTVNLLVNYPSTNFITLPIKLHVSDLVIHSIASIAYLNNSAFFSFLCDVNETNSDYFSHRSGTQSAEHQFTSTNGGNFVDYVTGPNTRERIDIIKKVRIESEIGEVESNVLRNVGKVERFLVDQLRAIIRDEIAWPGWICFDFNEDPEEGSSDDDK